MKSDLLYKTACAAFSMLVLTSCGTRVRLVENDSSISYSYSKIKEMSGNKIAKELSDDVFELDISIKEGESFPNRYIIEGFNTVMQRPELPTGCEVTALCTALNYLGFDIDKVTLSDEFMPMDNNGIYTMREAYIGDPKAEEGFGCSAPVIVQTADDYFESIQSPCYAVDLTGISLNEVLYQVAQGRPVIVWSTIDLIQTPANYVWTTYDGEEMWFNDFQHCVVVYGYDTEQNTVCVADPLSGNINCDMQRFTEVYDLMGKQAVLICGDSQTKGKFVPREDKPQSPVLSRNKAERQAAVEQ